MPGEVGHLCYVYMFGVENADIEEAVEAAKSSERPTLTTRQKHTRECYVVAKEGADLARIEKEIVTMPNYFADYDTTVHFISQEELNTNHAGLPHGGFVIRNGETSEGTTLNSRCVRAFWRIL